jgi:hypothetical protein
MLLLVGALIAIIVLTRSGGTGFTNILGSSGSPGSTTYVPPASIINPSIAVSPQTFQQETAFAAGGIAAGTSVAESLLGSGGLLSNIASSGVANSVPIIGAALSSVMSIMMAASAKRAKQATSENQAVATAVPYWDKNIATVVSLYNSGQINNVGAAQLIDSAWAAYWSEVTAQIQPGRNGCQGGAVTQGPTQTFCGGKVYGAACCVGYDNLKNSNIYMKTAITQNWNTGKPTPAVIVAVFASKYGGINRPQYTVTFSAPR